MHIEELTRKATSCCINTSCGGNRVTQGQFFMASPDRWTLSIIVCPSTKLMATGLPQSELNLDALINVAGLAELVVKLDVRKRAA
jgi:hypothetical protein